MFQISQPRRGEEDGDTSSGVNSGAQVNNKVLQNFHKSFVQVQNILDQNRLLIDEISQNQESKIPGGLCRNVALIKELNINIRKVVDLSGDLSSPVAESKGHSIGAWRPEEQAAQKRFRPG